jgi:hypothetical protein
MFGVQAHDPVTFGLVLGLLPLAALVVCYVPARI